MLASGFGVVAALAVVLAIGAFCVWLLKRYGAGSLLPKSRLTVEVVQRVSLGPKVGLAVVRVGEKVMAISIGDGGVRALFELNEADRLRVLSTSSLATPLAMDAAPLDPSFAAAFAASVASQPDVAPTGTNAQAVREAPRSLFTSSQYSPRVVTSAGEPVTYTRASLPGSVRDRDFRAMLGQSLSGATRLVVLFVALMLASGAVAPARAQVAPPVSQPPVSQPPVAPAAAPSPQDSLKPPPVAAPVPRAVVAPELKSALAPQSVPRNVRGVSPARAAATATPAATSQVPAKGNGASVVPGGANATRPMMQMIIDSARSNAAKGDSTRKRAAPASAAPTAPIAADDAIARMMPQMDMRIGDGQDGGLRLNGTVGIVVMMGLLTLLPTLLLMMTGFTRILIVLHFLKQAMGTQGAPPAQLLAGLALLLTGFVMAPVLTKVNRDAITPWLDGQITQVQMLSTGVKPLREFMLRQTKAEDLKAFVELSHLPRPNTVDDVPLHVLMSAFVASELRTSFYIGFMIYLPFIIIDAVVASVLMSMGMMMLPPAMVSLPFKLLLFVLVDGWTLTITSLVQSFK